MKHKNTSIIIILLTIIGFSVLLAACSSSTPPPMQANPPTASATIISPTISATEIATSTPIPPPPPDLTFIGIATAIAQRNPGSRWRPDYADRLVERVTNDAGLADLEFLGLSVKNWINLAISILLMVLVIVLGVWLLFALLKRIVRRTKTQFDDALLDTIGREVRWLIAIFVTRWAVLRLDVFSLNLWSLLEDVFFLVTLGVLVLIALRVEAFLAEWYLDVRVPTEKKKQSLLTIELLKRLGFLFILIVALGAAVSHFGFPISLSFVALLFLVFIGFIAARGTTEDFISGLIILIDQPIRIGDKVHFVELDIQGEVIEIGFRFSRIRTLDNYEYVILNSQLGTAINYNAPDASVRVSTDIAVGYGVDFDWAKSVIEQAVRSVAGVLPDKPVEVWYLSWDHSNRAVRVLWWIEDIIYEFPIRDQVNAAIERAMYKEGVDFNWQTFNLNLETKPEGIDDGAQEVPKKKDDKGNISKD